MPASTTPMRTCFRNADLFDEEDGDESAKVEAAEVAEREADFKRRAAEIYADYAARYKRRFKWMRPSLFIRRPSERPAERCPCTVRRLTPSRRMGSSARHQT